MYISINGEHISSDRAKIALSEGYNFGYGLFETVKVEDGKLLFWSDHIDRLKRGLKRIGLEESLCERKLLEKAGNLLETNGLWAGALKLIVSKSGDSRDIVMTTRVADYPESLYIKGFSLNLSESKRNAHSLIPYVKSLNYMENIIERNKSIKKGFDDCLFLNTDGAIAETSISNIFFIRDGHIYTPSIETGILDGIIRAKVISALEELGYTVYRGEYPIDKLLDSEEVFLTNSLMGVMPVGAFGERKYDMENSHITRAVQKRYGEMIYAEINA